MAMEHVFYAVFEILLVGLLTSGIVAVDVSDPQPTISDSCRDVLETCYLLDLSYYCHGAFTEWAYENCRKTCQICDLNMDKKCSYNETTYFPGSFWKGGCSSDGYMNCTCVNAAVPFVHCSKTRCPQYVNLPSACHLRVPSKGCCKEPVCDVDYHYGKYWAGCYFNGKHYRSGQNWTDGCSDCNCYNGSATCSTSCLNWNNLPSVCHMEEAPPGLCCDQPSCPEYINIKVPHAYQDKYPGYAIVG